MVAPGLCLSALLTLIRIEAEGGERNVVFWRQTRCSLFSWVQAEGKEAGEKTEHPMLPKVGKAGAETPSEAAMGSGTGEQGRSPGLGALPRVSRWPCSRARGPLGAGDGFSGSTGHGLLCLPVPPHQQNDGARSAATVIHHYQDTASFTPLLNSPARFHQKGKMEEVFFFPFFFLSLIEIYSESEWLSLSRNQ